MKKSKKLYSILFIGIMAFLATFSGGLVLTFSGNTGEEQGMEKPAEASPNKFDVYIMTYDITSPTGSNSTRGGTAEAWLKGVFGIWSASSDGQWTAHAYHNYSEWGHAKVKPNSGYGFKGWYSNQACTNKIYNESWTWADNDDNGETGGDTGKNDGIYQLGQTSSYSTVYAKVQAVAPITFSIYNTNGYASGSYIKTPDGDKHIYPFAYSGACGDDYTLTASANTGYHFDGYYSNNSYQGMSYTYWGQYSSTNIQARFSPNTYSVSFNANGGTGSMASQSMTYDSSYSLKSNSFTKAGYIFKGWNTQANGSGTSYTNGQSVRNLTSINGETITLYAQWQDATPPVITRSYVEPFDTYFNIYSYVTDDAGVSNVEVFARRNNNSASANGNALSGSWTVDGNVYNYKYTVDITNIGKKGEYSITIEATDMTGLKTTATTSYNYSITLHLDSAGGSLNGNQDHSLAYGDAIGLPTPSRPGYQFIGWMPKNTAQNAKLSKTGGCGILLQSLGQLTHTLRRVRVDITFITMSIMAL